MCNGLDLSGAIAPSQIKQTRVNLSRPKRPGRLRKMEADLNPDISPHSHGVRVRESSTFPNATPRLEQAIAVDRIALGAYDENKWQRSGCYSCSFISGCDSYDVRSPDSLD